MNTRNLKLTGAFALTIIILGQLSCNRDNPFDSKSGNFVSGKKPVAVFLYKTMSAFLYDTISIPIVCSDTTFGGAKGAIKRFYFNWHNAMVFDDSVDATVSDTFVIKKAFPPGTVVGRVMAVDFDGNYSDEDSIKLNIRMSQPHIASINAPSTIEKMVNCTLSVTASDSGGTIQSYIWAKNGTSFDDTASAGLFQVSFNDTGRKIILIKVRDNKAVESAEDTIRINVYEKHYRVIYDGNGSTGGTIPVDLNNYSQGQIITVVGNSGGCVKPGYAFTGWNTQANAGGASYSAGATFTMATANDTLYAQWAINPTYAVTYNGNGSTGGSVPLDTGRYSLGQSVTTRGNTGSLVKASFTFVGWNTQANGSGISYAMGVSFTMGSGNVILYAQWTANPTYTVTYNGNGNTGGSVVADNNNYADGATVTVLGNAGSLVKTGFTFVGWNTQADGGGTGYAGGVTFSVTSASVVLYAQWTANATYMVAYDGNGNTSGSVPIDGNSYAQGQIVTTRNFGTLALTGYVFTGWNTQAGGTGTAYAAGATFAMGTATVTLYAQWAVNHTYTVTYNGNGNTGGAVPADTGHYPLGQSVKVLGNTGSLVKAGFTFVGWNTQANGSGISYAAGVSFTMGSASMILYAQWTANPTYTVTYNGNGSTGGSVPADNNNYADGATVTVLGNTGSLVKTGYTFVGWNTQAGGGGTSYAGGVTFAIGSAGVILYAQWTANPTYIVTYNGNGNTGGIVPIDVNSYAQGQIVTARNFGTMAKAGYAFTGWNTQAAGGGTGTAYAAGATFAMGTANVTLYAQWAVNPAYTVTYNGNGSTGGTVPADTGHYSLGQSVTTRGNTGSLVKAGFTFVGWNTQAGGGGTGYATGVSFTMGSANVILYAQWTVNPTYSVTYNGNGGTGGTVPSDINNYQSGATVTVLGNTGSLVKTGYTFVGWNTQAGGGGTSYAGGVTFAIGSAGVILYAQWTANPTYIVTYNGNANSGGTIPVDANNYASGAVITVLNQGSLVKSGFTFNGWNTRANGTGTSYAVGSTFAIGTANVTLYARWTAIPTYTVTYNGNGSTGGTVPLDTGHYTLGQSVTTRGNTGALVKAGYTFAGWNTQAGGAGNSYTAGVSFTMGSASVTLYAQWTAIPTYTVTYDGNGNTGGTVPADTARYPAQANVTVLGNTGALVKAGYAFVGWNTKTNGTGTSYAGGAAFTIGTAGVILYAQWTANPTHTVTYDGNGNTGGTIPVDANNYMTGAMVTVVNQGSLVKSGFTFSGWNTLANGTGTGYAVGATFAMAAANDTLYAQWAAIPTYTVTYDGNGNTGGTVPADTAHYILGQNVLTKTNAGLLAKTGFTFVGWNTLANGLGIGYPEGAALLMGSANVILYARWTALPTFAIIATAGVHGSISPSGSVTVVSGTDRTFSIRPATNYHVVDIQIDGVSQVADTSYTFTNVTASHAIAVSFVIDTFTLTSSAGSGGSISPSGVTKDTAMASQGYTLTPDAHHHITSLVVDNVSQAISSSYTFSNIVAGHTIAVSFGVDSFTITAGTAGNGSISPPGATIDTAMASQAYTITAAPHYHITGLLVDNVPHAIGSSYTFTNVLANHSIAVAFGVDSFTITSSAGANGAISPLGATTDTAMASQGYTITPDANYHITGLTVDGVSQAIGSSYTFTNIIANRTIAVTFGIDSFTVTYNGNGSDGGSVPAAPASYGVGETVTVLDNTGVLTNSITPTFSGWNTQALGGGTSYTVLPSSFTMPAGPVTLYAQWQ